VTGGSGFVGGAIVARLVADGRAVRVLCRSSTAADKVRAAGAAPVQGDVLDDSALAEALRDCRIVYHAAGVNAFCLPDPKPMFEVNVEGTRRVVRAAAAAGVGRVVYTSSAATVGEAKGTVGREDSPHRGWFLSQYERSKYDAERVALDTAEAEGVDLVCVNPSSVQGPGRTHGTAKLLLSYANGKLPVAVDTRFSILDVADCAAGHLLAEAHGKPGERYLLSGATLTVAQAVDMVARVTGVRRPLRMLPAPLALGAAAGVGFAARLAKRRSRICPEMMRTLLHGHMYDGSKATRELGLRYTPIEDTIRRGFEWYAAHGMLRTT